MNYYDANWDDPPATRAQERAARHEQYQARYDKFFAEAMRGSEAFLRDVDVDAILEAARRSVFSLGLRTDERYMILFRAYADEAGKWSDLHARGEL